MAEPAMLASDSLTFQTPTRNVSLVLRMVSGHLWVAAYLTDRGLTGGKIACALAEPEQCYVDLICTCELWVGAANFQILRKDAEGIATSFGLEVCREKKQGDAA